MKIGILSDSHDNRETAADALALFISENVQTILHLGDVCQPLVLEPFRFAGIPLIGVFGNNDGNRQGLQQVSMNGFHPGPHILTLDGRKILMAHIFDELQREIGEGGKFDLILFGHTHRPLTMRVGRAVVINPGEACGFMSGRPTCALVDLPTITARILDIPLGEGGRASVSSDIAGRR
ncbi:MAG: metallophosphoesterase [Deltaproteobacteria bacterium]|nr:metallophosphoesterase [Deltaproteobacteria bacterium]